MADSDDPREVFHEGELAVQERVGVRERIEQIGAAIIRDAMPIEHRQFFERLPTLLVGSVDASGRPWASIVAGWPGFVHALDEKHLRIDASPATHDPLAAHLSAGAPLGLLGIEPATRRRNRMNGTVVAADPAGFTVRVDQSFGNCPQYIQARRPEWTRDPSSSARSASGDAQAEPHRADDASPDEPLGAALGEASLALVRSADTFFIASAAARARSGGSDGVDVSHRGGKPGFVRVTEQGGASVLTFPDFRGNFLFNTLGNLTVNPCAGLLFVDYRSGDVLQIAGSARILWEGPEVAAFAKAQRLVEITARGGRLARSALPLRWSDPQQASQLRDTGSWPAAGS